MQAEVIMASACFLLIIIKMWRQMNVVSEKSTIFANGVEIRYRHIKK